MNHFPVRVVPFIFSMALITLQDITLSFGGPQLFNGINLQIEAGERICLVGRNGEGKSTLMQIIGGELEPDSGSVIKRQGLKVSRLMQDIPKNFLSGKVRQVVAEGLGELAGLQKKRQLLAEDLAQSGSEKLLSELAELDQQMETAGGWQVQQQLDSVLSRCSLNGDTLFEDLSGGMKRRVLLARTLVNEPELLLLDEPTNHLDLETIDWLENFLLSSPHTLFFVTHDRTLIRKQATRIVDLDRGQLTSWPGDYDTYLRRREEMLSAAAGQQARFDRKLAQEEIWIRQGIKARRTRNEGRVRALLEMRRLRRERREQLGNVRMEISEAGLSGKLVAVLKDVSFSYADKKIIKGCSTAVLRGDRIGILGPNGAGKTTLLRLLTGELSPERGEIRLGTNLQISYFDQQRAGLDPEKTVIDNLGDGKDIIESNGQRRHIIGYLQDFLFTPDRARSPVSVLSGGERNRLMLAKLFARPSNLLVLDEPTNDLDMETLELLEELLQEYKGTILLVSHDRAFLNNVVTSTLVFEGDGRVQEYAGGFDDWLRQRPQIRQEKTKEKKVARKPTNKETGLRKLTFKEIGELDELPGFIEKMEEEQQQLFQSLADPTFYQQDGERIGSMKSRLQQLENDLAAAYERWQQLESIKGLHLKKKK